MDVRVKNISDYKKEKDFLICIDSDGCAFNVMEIKWKECFIPALIKCFELQPISKYVRQEAERINLYSKTRGINRFAGLPILFDMLEQNSEVNTYNFNLPDTNVLKAWISKTAKLSIESLQKEFYLTADTTLERTLLWSNEANKNIKEMVYGIPPFPFVRELLEKFNIYADIAVVSSANLAALESEWKEHKLTPYINILCAQEMGTKEECIRKLKSCGYDSKHILMVGDALGDLEAAKNNDVLFYPIIPNKENISWKNLYSQTAEQFINNNYGNTEENILIEEFKKVLV